MPLPSSENDLKRRARRRLIGAVALTLLAVIVLPLLLEDEPPPASSLAVRMAATPQPVVHAPSPAEPVVAAEPAQSQTQVSPEVEIEPVQPATHPEPAKPATVSEQAKAEAKPVSKPQVSPKPAGAVVPESKPTAAGESFVVQLAALSDPVKAQALKTRAAKAGLPAFTDKVGALTRVRVGPYSSRAEAVAAAVKLAENGMGGQVLVK